MIDTDIYLGRQPIFNAEGRCLGYELLYREKGSSVALIQDDTKATARVMINLLHNIGLSSIIGDKTGYINVDDHTLLSDSLLSLPKEQFIIEILEYTKMSVALVQRVQYLHELGYRFALDDFCCKNDSIEYFKMLFPYIDIVKIDLLLSHEVNFEEMAERFKPYNVTLLAEKVENMEMFQRCREAGFELFQGYFFEKPTIISGKKIEPSLHNVIDLINTLYATDDINVITQRFSQYPELTFNLLRHVNSAAYHFAHTITSIKQILTLLGPSRLRSWLGLFMYAGSEKCIFAEAIFNGAKFRAKMMFELVSAHGKPNLADEAFLVGSLSLIDAYLHIPMETITEQIQLSKPIVDALSRREGYLGKILTMTERLETTDKIQSMIEYLSPKLGLPPQLLYSLYCDANEYVLSGSDT